MRRLIQGRRSLILLCTLLLVMFSTPLEEREGARVWVYVAGVLLPGLAGAYVLMPDRKWFMAYLVVVIEEWKESRKRVKEQMPSLLESLQSVGIQ